MSPPASPRLAIVAGFFVLTAGGCVQQQLANRFSEEFSCPVNRVTVTERPLAAPPEIAADPERLEIYKRTQDRVFQARGCDRERIYVVATHRDSRDRYHQ